MSGNFAARLAPANLASKNDIANFIKKTDFDDKLKNLNKKVTSNKTRHIVVKTKLDDLEKNAKIISTNGLTTDMINKYKVLNRAKCFSLNGLQNYLVFQLFISHFLTKNGTIYSLKSKEMSKESITPPCTTGEGFYPEIIGLHGSKYELKFKEMCLKQNIVSFLHKDIVNLYATYKLGAWSEDLNTDFTLGNWLYGAVKLTKNTDPDKYKYSIRFHSRSQFSWTD